MTSESVASKFSLVCGQDYQRSLSKVTLLLLMVTMAMMLVIHGSAMQNLHVRHCICIVLDLTLAFIKTIGAA